MPMADAFTLSAIPRHIDMRPRTDGASVIRSRAGAPVSRPRAGAPRLRRLRQAGHRVAAFIPARCIAAVGMAAICILAFCAGTVHAQPLPQSAQAAPDAAPAAQAAPDGAPAARASPDRAPAAQAAPDRAPAAQAAPDRAPAAQAAPDRAPAAQAAPDRAPASPRLAAVSGKVDLLDRIVAVVNKDVITKSQLDERLDLVMRQLRQQNVQPPERATLEKQVLERLIMDRAQLQLAEDSGIKIDDLQVDRAVERIAEQNKMSLSRFREAVERDGVSFDKLREDLRTEITLARLREREVDSRIQVSDSEIDNYMAENAGKPRETANAEYDVAHVLVRVPEGASPEQVDSLRQRAEKAVSEARSGEDFAKVAVTFSDAPDALQGGGMGWRSRDRLPDLFLSALERMKPGDTSDVLRSPAGFHVVHLNDRRGVAPPLTDIEQTHARHILIRTNELVSDAEARRRIDQLRARIAQGEDFAELARLNSDDSSATRGGDLGWLYPGDTVPEFESAMSKLQPKDLSEPVRTPFGWHLIQVLERRRGDVSADRRRLEARKAVRERKADESYEEWLRELRDRTYTELRLDDR